MLTLLWLGFVLWTFTGKAHTLLAQQDYELASRFLARILTTEPSNVEARELLGVCDLELGNVEEARNVSSPFQPQAQAQAQPLLPSSSSSPPLPPFPLFVPSFSALPPPRQHNPHPLLPLPLPRPTRFLPSRIPSPLRIRRSDP